MTDDSDASDIENFMLLNNLIFSSDSDSSELDDNENFARRIPRVKDYVLTVVHQYTDNEFRQNFRMSRNAFNYVLNIIKDEISSLINDKGRHTINAETQLLLALWYFASPDSYRSICTKFNVGKATALRSVRRVTNALFDISPQIITWPSGEYADEVVRGFENMEFPSTIGCIDGSYIPIPLPKENGQAYVCRKNFPCIVLQAVCDHRLMFTNCYVGEAGSTHDATVLRRSEVWEFMNNAEKFPNNTHLLGDKAYPCLPTLLTPYKDNGHLTPQQRHYNFRLSSARSTIERAFGLLKKRQRSMKFLDVKSLQWIPKYVIASCVLHNICIVQNDFQLDENINEINDNDDEHVEIEDREIRERKRLGIEKRNRICIDIGN